jgi:dipeptidyl aminopeptidase/acylaminoacyl peptidase
MLGRSMGGGVTLNALVVAPGLVDAAVVYASVSSSTWDNHVQWTRPGRPAVAAAIEGRHGTRQTAPDFWRGVSPRTYFDRVSDPVLVHHGTADDTCPIAWADETVDALESAGARVTYAVSPGEGHTFEAGWLRSIERTVAFLRRHLA